VKYKERKLKVDKILGLQFKTSLETVKMPTVPFMLNKISSELDV
jgi:hypothetical protein